MAYTTGTEIRITCIQKRDYNWEFEEFEKTSALLNGCKGKILEYWQPASDFCETDSYYVEVETTEGKTEYELEEDEFEIIEKNS